MLSDLILLVLLVVIAVTDIVLCSFPLFFVAEVIHFPLVLFKLKAVCIRVREMDKMGQDQRYLDSLKERKEDREIREKKDGKIDSYK